MSATVDADAGSRAWVLVVDDNPGDRRLISEALVCRSEAIRARVVGSGSEALALLERAHSAPSLILLDLNLPCAGGLQVLRALRAQPRYAEVPIAIFTSSAGEADRDACLAAGASAFVTKPPDLDGFLAAVCEVAARAGLPKAEAVAAPPARGDTLQSGGEAKSPSSAGARAIRVLLIEDNPGDARLVALALEEASGEFSLEHVSRLGAALPRLAAGAVDVALLDLALPDARGLDALHQVNAAAPSLPVVVLTGQSDDSVALRAVQSGAQDFLVKGRADADRVARAIRYAIERVRADERVAYLAHHDALTGLANRALFQERLRHAVARARRDAGPLAVLFVDLDRFKPINDTLGHEAGDQVLCEIARRLRSCVRESDTVARLGGDEFTLIVEGLEGPASAEAVARKVLDRVRPSIEVLGREVSVTPSIGVAVFPDDGRDAQALLASADAAMYRAKQSGRDNVQLASTTDARVQDCEDVARALEQGALGLRLRPRVCLLSGHVQAVQALPCWRPALGGAGDRARPMAAVDAHARGGRVLELYLEQACRAAVGWGDTRIVVSLSEADLDSGALVERVSRALAVSGLDAARLELGIAEGALSRPSDARGATLAALRELGVALAAEDFGTADLGLPQIASLGLRALRIAPELIDRIERDADAGALIGATAAVARNLGLECVADGVERSAQASLLPGRGCALAQGPLYGEIEQASAFDPLAPHAVAAALGA